VRLTARWTNEQLLFHMLFGYLVVRNLRVIVKLFSRCPEPASRVFAALLNAATTPFHLTNFWVPAPEPECSDTRGWVADSTRRSPRCSATWTAKTNPSSVGGCIFPTRSDPFFTDVMTLGEVYHYPTQHFDFHRAQLTLARPG
jgi:hypothetical protein